MTQNTSNNLAQYIDHTLLKPEATEKQIITLCSEATKYKFFGVCVNSRFVPVCVQELKDSGVAVVSVVGFPLGAVESKTKAFEADWVVKQGATEVDMVISLGALKEKNFKYVTEDIRSVVKAAQNHVVKVILETCLLTDEEKIAACNCSIEAGAHFVKTSTGFSTGGATLADVQLMKKTVGDRMKVKASGGVKTSQQAMEFIQAGAARLGTSSGIALIHGQTVQTGY